LEGIVDNIEGEFLLDCLTVAGVAELLALGFGVSFFGVDDVSEGRVAGSAGHVQVGEGVSGGIVRFNGELGGLASEGAFFGETVTAHRGIGIYLEPVSLLALRTFVFGVGINLAVRDFSFFAGGGIEGVVGVFAGDAVDG